MVNMPQKFYVINNKCTMARKFFKRFFIFLIQK